MKKTSGATVSLNLVIPTFNRPDLLALTLASVEAAECPKNLALAICVVDNNSTEDNSSRYKSLISRFPRLKISYLMEKRQGRSWALNSGISHSTADFVGFIDDDETVDKLWLVVATENILTDQLDYFGGACLPKWESTAPNWLPIHLGHYKGVLGWIEQSDKIMPFDDFSGTLVGGNAVVRRSVLTALGGYSTDLGRGSSNLMGGEDEEFHRRLRAFGAKGNYDPRMIIYHFVPTLRMSKKYHLRWAFWSGATNGKRLNWEEKEAVPYLFGLPRYRYRMAIVGILKFASSTLRGNDTDKARGFTGLMDASYFFGMVFGKRWL